MRLKTSVLAIASTFAMTGVAHATTTIEFWHSMEGKLGETVNKIVDDFNHSQSEYKVVATYKGSYTDSMNAGIAAYRAKKAPNILQVFEVGTATMMYSKGAIVPVGELSEKVGNPIQASDFITGIASYYSDKDGKLVSMPFNSSTPVFYYNKDLFKQAGLDPEKPPRTYEELRDYGNKLKAAGVECAYTTTWPAWVMIENFAAIANTPYATENNGFDGLNARLALDSDAFKKHLTFLADMAKEGSFTYGGRADNATGRFTSGKCAMFTGSSGARATIVATGINYGVGYLPYYADNTDPHNSIIGGASLWAFSGKSDDENKATVAFFKYLTKPEVAAFWHQKTGYVPVVKAAYELTEAQGYYQENPGADIAVKQLNRTAATNSKGIRLGFLPAIRDIEERNLEDLFNGKITADKALSNMKTDGDKLLERFQKQTEK
ncbi:sn-glycerol-3-phosphate ABC transporter substrate-binding protein UgpB [Basilea psittacipulmonis]|uniref:sn-glycerol-3-phosphate-binding periplasmic protein UgpB n=1 Tax=Basilea psittacipulmonis DSM 24701 TaxID=1072685 RepID=A0A077DCB5_9BURK|nr:sn-glycerol-3-phosphate ABC transporter substrate-binding protein UgpB [Basilea psittacipulmonis]AIL32540.1 glycerol-3-phosphate ABC transporter substrate-binding protein [Basilea psittacipulmonis DSM 24701]